MSQQISPHNSHRPRWSTIRTATPGVARKRRRWQVQICLRVGGKSRSVYVGLFRSEWIAGRVSTVARIAKASGVLDGCDSVRSARERLTVVLRRVLEDARRM